MLSPYLVFKVLHSYLFISKLPNSLCYQKTASQEAAFKNNKIKTKSAASFV